MKTVLAQSYTAFQQTMLANGLDDDNVEKRGKACFIEICGEQDLLHMPHWFKRDHPNVLRLEFDDVEEPLQVHRLGEDGREYIPVVPITEAQGKAVLAFVERNREADICIVHCAAGVSRSGAIAQWISEYNGISYETFKMLNRHTIPNEEVLRVLRKLTKEQYSSNPDGYT